MEKRSDAVKNVSQKVARIGVHYSILLNEGLSSEY